MNGKSILIAMCLMLASYGIAGADYLIVDQEHMGNVNSWHTLSNNSANGYKFDQGFTPYEETMDTVRVELYTDQGATLKINIREGSIDGNIIATSKKVSLHPGNSSVMAEFSFNPPVQLTPGNLYIMDIQLERGSASIASGFEGGGYLDGLMYINGINYETDYSDVIFQTGNSQPCRGGCIGQ